MNIVAPKINADFTIKAFDIEKHTLSNGIDCFTINNFNSEIVKFNLVFNAGTKYGKAAVIKLLSKLVFDGSKQYSGDMFAENIDRRGAYVFCKPSTDRLVFSIVCQKKDFKELLPIFIDAIFNPELKEDNIKTTIRKEVNNLTEAFQYSTTIAEHVFIPAVFGEDNPYSQVLKPENYSNITRDDLVDFHQKFINIDNGFALLSAEIDDGLIASLLPLEMISGNGFKVPIIQLPDYDYEPLVERIVNKHSIQSFILLGNKTIIKNHPDYIKFKIVSTLLGGYIGSRLMQNIREKSGFTYDIYSSLSSNEQLGLFRIGSEIQVGKEDEVLHEIEIEIKRLHEEPFSDGELNRLKNYMMGELLNTFDGMFARDGAFLSVHNFGLDLSFYERFQKTIQSLNAETIQLIAKQYLNFDLFSKITVVPE